MLVLRVCGAESWTSVHGLSTCWLVLMPGLVGATVLAVLQMLCALAAVAGYPAALLPLSLIDLGVAESVGAWVAGEGHVATKQCAPGL